MTTTPLSIAVIICTYSLERWHDLCAAVRSVERQTYLPHELIIVVDHNPALLAQAQATFPTAHVIANRATQGLAGARNSALAVARSDILAFLDDDGVAAPDWLERLYAAYADPHVLGVGGSIAPTWDHGRPAWFPVEFDWVVGCTYRGMPEQDAAVRNLIGCNMSLRRTAIKAVGPFRSDLGRVGTLPLGCEETELCLRIGQHYADGILRYQPATRVSQRVPAARATWRYFLRRCYAEGVSKALVARISGAQRGLATERRYVLRVLPSGVARGLAAALRGDPAGLGRAAAIVGGLATTVAGYVRGRLHRGSRTVSAPTIALEGAPE